MKKIFLLCLISLLVPYVDAEKTGVGNKLFSGTNAVSGSIGVYGSTSDNILGTRDRRGMKGLGVNSGSKQLTLESKPLEHVSYSELQVDLSAEYESGLSDAYCMCAVTDSGGDLMVGFFDKTQNNTDKYYYLRVGDSQGDIELLEADYSAGAAKLSKHGEVFRIYMNTMRCQSEGGRAPHEVLAETFGVNNDNVLNKVRLQKINNRILLRKKLLNRIGLFHVRNLD